MSETRRNLGGGGNALRFNFFNNYYAGLSLESEA